MPARFSRKFKILAVCGVVLAFVVQHFVSRYQEVSYLRSMLAQDNFELKIEAATKLGHLGSQASGATGNLAVYVRHPDYSIRAAAISALMRIDRQEAIDIFADSLGHKDPGVRMDVHEALVRMGSRRAHELAKESQSASREHYQRTRLRDWAQSVRAEYKKEKKRKYRRHMKVYGK